MTRATWVFVATTVAGVALAVWLFLDNRSLRAELAKGTAATTAQKPPSTEKVAAARTDAWSGFRSTAGEGKTGTGPAPKLPDANDETRLERRQRRQQEFAAMFGRLDG